MNESEQPDYQSQHKKRLAYMPWLYYRLKPKHKIWALPWQAQVQANLMALETIQFGDNCFIAPEANLFAEPGRQITIGDHTAIAADTFIHGPLTVGRNVGINHGCSFDGGRHGIIIGDDCRIASGVAIYAFNHGMAANAPIHQQPVSSHGVVLGKDVWIGSRVCIRDGVTIKDHAVIGMGAVITKDVPAYAIMAGNPARFVGDRRDKPDIHPDHLATN